MRNSNSGESSFACETGAPPNRVLIADHTRVAAAICSLLHDEFPMLNFVLEDEPEAVVAKLRSNPPRWHRLIIDAERYGRATNDILQHVLALELQSVTCLVCGAPDRDASSLYRRLGFLAYIPKHASARDFALALTAAVNGERSFPDAPQLESPSLTGRQLAVLESLRDGLTPGHVAYEHRIPIARVRLHLEAAIAALGASSATNAVARAIELGLLPPESKR